MGDGMPLKVTMRRADHLDMSDLSRLLDDVYSTGPASPPAAPPPTAAEPDLPWATEESMDEAFADWVPGPAADAPQAERDLFELAGVDDAPAQATSVLEHRFVADQAPADSLGDLAAPATLADALGDVADLPVAAEEPLAAFAAEALEEDDVEEAPAPEVLSFAGPVPDDEPVADQMVDAFEPTVALTDLFAEEPEPAPVAPAAPALAYEPPATLAEALIDAPDEVPTALVADEDEWPLAGLAPVRPAAAPEVEILDGVLGTTWRREHDDLLPTRGRRR